MKREIKFRVLDASGQMVFSDKHYKDDLGMFFEQMSSDGIGVMQYTGRRDKNGVDIYEGDIVLAPNGTDWIVEYFAPTFTLRCVCHHPDGDFAEFERIPAFYKIIGNIYENPELLEQS